MTSPYDLTHPTVPPGFHEEVYERTWDVEIERARVWAWLDDTETFTRGQPFPYRVEFLTLADGRPGTSFPAA